MEKRATARCVAVGLALLALLAGRAEAAIWRSGETVAVGSDERLDDDLYLSGGTVNVRGKVAGDVAVFGGKVTLDAAVAGDVLVAGGDVTILGDVDGSVRVAGGSVLVQARVGRDVAATGGRVALARDAVVRGDLLCGAGRVTVAGKVGGSVVAGANELVLDGPIARDVQARAGTVEVGDAARIGGSLTYTSPVSARVASGARIAGPVTHEPMPVQSSRSLALLWLRALVGLAVAGLLFVLATPAFAQRTNAMLAQTFTGSFGFGLLLALVVPIAAVVLFAAGLLVGGWWLALVLLALEALAMLLGFGAASLRIGTWVLARLQGPDRAPLAVLVGVTLLLVVAVAPLFGPLAILVATLAGLGAVVRAAFDARKASVAPVPAVEVPSREPERRPPLGPTVPHHPEPPPMEP